MSLDEQSLDSDSLCADDGGGGGGESHENCDEEEETTTSSTATGTSPKEKSLTLRDIECGYDFDTPEEYLLYYSRAGNVEIVDKLFSFKETGEIELDINCKGKQKSNYGWSPLHLSCYFGHVRVAELLLEKSAEVNVLNETADTPLHKASYTGRLDIVTLLLTFNADVFLMNDEGKSPRDLAQSRAIGELLLAAEQADMKRKEEKFFSAARSGDMNSLHLFLNDPYNPVNINSQDMSGNSALHCAAYRGQEESAVFLLKSGIDVNLRNKKNQLAIALAPTLRMKQLLQDIRPVTVKTLPKSTVIRFEGPLLRKKRFLGWRAVWSVLERGVLSFFSSRADAATGTKRRGYKYLESATVETSDKDPTVFTIFFSDKSKVVLSITPGSTLSANQIDRQKWINAVSEHIQYSTNFIRQGVLVDDEEEDDLRELMAVSLMQPMLQTAQAHHAILEKHIKGLMQFVEEDIHSFEDLAQAKNTGTGELKQKIGNSSFYVSTKSGDFTDIWSALKFHLNLILESSGNTSSSLNQAMAVLSQQEQLRQLQLKQEKDKCRVLEEALGVLAQEHHDMEQSIVCAVPYHSPPRPQSCADTDVDEFFDAFDDESENEKDEEEADRASKSDRTLVSTVSRYDSAECNLTQATFNSAYETPLGSLSDLCEADAAAQGHVVMRRTRLPSPMISRNDVSLWSILKNCIGKELSKIALPVVFNEPVSFLQRLMENAEYLHLLKDADMCDDPVQRMEIICAYAVASLSSNWQRMNKPFNPLLGETYELSLEEFGYKAVCEQVSHHPPISAYYGESDNFLVYGSVQPKLKFWGKSIEVRPDGYIHVKLKRHNEVYTWRNVNCCVHNIIVGKLWFEQYGLMEIVNDTNGLQAQLNFKAAGWFGKDLHRLDGFIYAKDKQTKLRFIYGKWTNYLKSAAVEDYDEYLREHAQNFRVPDKPAEVSQNVPDNDNEAQFSSRNGSVGGGGNGEIPKSDSTNSLDIPNSKLLWTVVPRPDYSGDYYDMTVFSMSLNELAAEMRNSLPPTDSRLRPDVRLLEEGDIDLAASEKNRLEEKQREVRRLRKKGREDWSPLWFRTEHNPHSKETEWTYSGGYFDRTQFSKCPDLF